MKAWLRSVYGAIFASLLTIALNGNVYADTEDAVLPDEAPTQIIEPEAPAEAVPAAFVDEAVVSEPSAPPPATETAVLAVESTVQNTAVGTEQITVPVTETDTTGEMQSVDTILSKTEASSEAQQEEVPEEIPATQSLTDAASLEHTVQAEFPAEDDAAADTLDSETVKGDSSADDTAAELSGEEAVASDASAESSDDGEAPAEESTAYLSALMAVAENETADETFSADSEEEAVTEAEPMRGNSSSDTSLTRTKSGIYVMVNHSGQEKLEAQGDITILAAGVNRVSSISGTGKVQIAGTGILLVDNLQGNLELLTLTDIYDKGSTAVFVKQAGTTSTYQLVNGTVPGILDEEYRIEGCTLVVPSGGNLLLCGTGAEPLSDGTVAYYHGTDHDYHANCFDVVEMTGKLTIAEKAALIIKQGASVILENLKTLGHGDITDDGRRHPTLAIENGGSLTVDGTVGNDGIVWIGGDCTLSGNGSITTNRLSIGDPSAVQSSHVSLDAHDLYLYGSGAIPELKIHNTNVYPGNSTIKISGLVSSGDCMIVFKESSDLNISKVDGTLVLRSDDSQSPIGISGNVQGEGTINFESGIYTLPEGTELNKVSVANWAGGIVYDYAGVLPTSLFPLHIQPENLPYPTPDGNKMVIPVVAGRLDIDPQRSGGSRISIRETIPISVIVYVWGYYNSESDKFFFLDLDDLKRNLEKEPGLDSSFVVELLRKDADGTLHIDSYFSEKLSGIIDANDLCLIRILCEHVSHYPEPDSDSTMTGMTYTGSGILGGDGAGSVNFGKPSTNTNNTGDEDPDDNGSGKSNTENSKKPQENKEKQKNTAAQAAAKLQVWATQEAGAYTLHAKAGDRILTSLDGYVDVFLDYTPTAQAAGKTIYIVFRDAAGKLVAFRASYGQLTGKLHFRTDRLGRFVILTFDFDGEEFSDAFYKALAACMEITALN